MLFLMKTAKLNSRRYKKALKTESKDHNNGNFKDVSILINSQYHELVILLI